MKQTAHRYILTFLTATVCCVLPVTSVPSQAADMTSDPRHYEVMRLRNGLVLPYPLQNVFRGMARCRRNRHTHRALDIGGVGPEWGVGTPIRAMAQSKVLHIGRPETSPKKYGPKLKGGGRVKRGGKMLPKSKRIKGYGRVYFFTEKYGKSRTGTLITMRVLAGRLRGYKLRYMHLAVTRPGLKPGDIVEAGEVIGLMGGTAVQTDAPHLHLDVENRRGKRIDVGPVFGIGKTASPCKDGKKAAWKVRKKYTKHARLLMIRFARRRANNRLIEEALNKCGKWTYKGKFSDPKIQAHRLRIQTRGAKGKWRIRMRVTQGRWKPKLAIRSGGENKIHTGVRARSWARRSYKIKTMHTGRKGKKAEFVLVPKGRDLILYMSAWGRRRPPRNAGYTLEIERKCK